MSKNLDPGPQEIAQLVNQLSCKHRTGVQSAEPMSLKKKKKLGMVAYACNPSSSEMET